MSHFAIALAVIACACTSFESIDRDVCGNGLVEAGEDCDSADDSCVRCAVVCTDAVDCPTTDYACGVDGLCHAPGGALEDPVPGGALQINDLAITDIDRDRIGDVVGVSRTSLVVRYGEASARLTRSDSLTTPAQTGSPAFGDVDGDGASDLTIVTPDGMVSYGSRFGTLAPIPVASSLAVEGSDIRDAFYIGRLTVGTFVVDAGNVSVAVVAFAGGSAFSGPCAARLGAIPAAAFSATQRDVYVVSPDDVVVAFNVATVPRKLCVLALHKPLLGTWTITDITPPNAAGLERRPVLADLEGDNDRCPGLINSDGGAAALRYWDGSMSAGGCTMQAVASPLGTPLPAVGAPAGTLAVGRIPLVPAIFGVASDALVLTDGAYVYQPGAGAGFGVIYTSQRRISGVEHGDLDGDGMMDAILSSESEDDVEVFYRRTNQIIPFYPGYVVLRLDTASRVVRTQLGDYDGNGRLDIAILEQLADYQRLTVSYGTADLLLPPVPISAFASVMALTTLAAPNSDDAAAITDDLLVIQPPLVNTSFPSLTILSGGVQRSMTPYYEPRNDDDTAGPSPRDTTTLRAAVVGRFVSGDAALDLIAVAVDKTQRPMAMPQLWRVPASQAGPDGTVTPGVPTTGFADCATGGGPALCVRDALYLAWPVSPTRDVAIAIDRSTPGNAVSFDPGTGATVAATPIAAITAKLPAGTTVRSMHSADLDGDGVMELVVAAGPRGTADTESAILVCTVDNGIPTSCTDLVPDIIAATQGTDAVVTACIDAAPARVAFRDSMSTVAVAQDLIAICRGGGSALYRVHRGEAGIEVTVLARTQTRLGALRIGDVTGDGLDDVIAIEGENGAQSLVVFPQCSSRNLAACSRGAGGGQ